MSCEQYLINILNADNFGIINDMAEMYNAEKLKEYCNWFYRRHASNLAIDNEMSVKDEDD